MGQKEKIEKLQDREWVELRSVLGNDWSMFFLILGARESGKSYDAMKILVRQWKKYERPFYWIRLSEVSTKKLLANNAEKLVDPDLRRKYNIKLKTKGMDVYDNGKKMATVIALSDMAKNKGVGFFDNEFLNNPKMYYNIVIDEFQREKQEKNYFDIVYNLVNSLENIVRSTKKKIRVIMIANTLSEASDVLAAFEFIPETFGIFKLRSKRCVVWNIPPTKAYLERRKGTIADILASNESTFTNKTEIDVSRIYKGKVLKPVNIIKFSKDTKDWFTVWDSRTIKKYNGEKCLNVTPMQPYLDEVFVKDKATNVIAMYDARALYFNNLITQRLFQKNLEMIRPRA